MKKLLLTSFLILFSIGLFSQVTNKNIEIRKAAPMLWLNGTSPLLKIDTDTAATKAYARSVGGGVGKLPISDTAAMLSKYARKLNPVFTGTYATTGGIVNLNVSSNFATNINSGTSTGTVTFGGSGIMAIDVGASTGVKTISIGTHATPINVINIGGTNSLITGYGTWTLPSTTGIGSVSATELGYLNGTASNIQTQLDDTINIAAVVPYLADTIPLVTFGAGGGLIADTACFNNGALAGTFYNEGSDTLYISQLMGILKEGTGTETISVQISWHSTMLSGSAVNLNSSALAITSMTTGTSDVSFSHHTIPPNVFVWCVFSGASANNKPTFLSITLSGYKKPTY